MQALQGVRHQHSECLRALHREGLLWSLVQEMPKIGFPSHDEQDRYATKRNGRSEDRAKSLRQLSTKI